MFLLHTSLKSLPVDYGYSNIILEDIRKLLSKNAFEDNQMLQYEDSLYPCPADYDKLLKIWYGDYMQIPPEGQKYIEEENELRKSDS